MASLNNPVNIQKLLADSQAVINANTDAKALSVNANVNAKTVETKAHVTTKNTDTKNVVTALVTSENDATQISVANVAANALTNQQLIDTVNANTDAKLAVLSMSPIKSIQRGVTGAGNDGNITIAAVDCSKTIVNLCNSGGEQNYGGRLKLVNSTTLYVFARMKVTADHGTTYWEVIEYA